MAFSKVKLCWSTTRIDAEWRLGLFGVYQRTKGGRLQGLAISVRGLLTWLGVLAVVGYFTAAGALWWWLDRKPHNRITYADLVLPTRWSSLKSLRGESLIARGKDNLKARRWSEGFSELRRGIELNPKETEGRLMLADVFLAMRARKQAVEIYEGALEQGYPGRPYMEALLRAAAQAEDFAWWLRACDRALGLVANQPALDADRRWLVQRKMEGLIGADRPAEAAALGEQEIAVAGPATKELYVLALLKIGRGSDAVSLLDRWALSSVRPDPQVLRLQARAYAETGDLAAMKRVLETLRQLTPESPRPYVYALVQTSRAGLADDTNQAVDRFLLRFGSSSDSVLMLASALAEVAGSDSVRRLFDHAREHGFALSPFVRVYVSSLVAKHAWPEAQAVLAQNPVSPEAGAPEKAWRALILAQINAVLDPADAVQTYLVGLVRDRQFTPKYYKELISSLRAAGRVETARQIVTFAQGIYPEHPLIETWRKELDQEIAAARAAKPEIKVVRVASTSSAPVAVPAKKEITKEAYRARLDELVGAGDFSSALAWLREVRLARPDWLSASDNELATEEISLAGRAGDLLALRSLVRLYNNGARAHTVELIRIARELHDVGRAEESVFVLREVLNKSPETPAAKKLLGEWIPEPGAALPADSP